MQDSSNTSFPYNFQYQRLTEEIHKQQHTWHTTMHIKLTKLQTISSNSSAKFYQKNIVLGEEQEMQTYLYFEGVRGETTSRNQWAYNQTPIRNAFHDNMFDPMKNIYFNDT